MCEGLRLEIRQLCLSGNPPHGSPTDPASRGPLSATTPLNSASQCDAATACDVDQNTLPVVNNGNDANGKPWVSVDGACGMLKTHRPTEDGAGQTRSLPEIGKHPQVLTSPESTGHAKPGNRWHVATGRVRHQLNIALFVQDLTHSEVGALVGPALLWKDPFAVRNRSGNKQPLNSQLTCLVALSHSPSSPPASRAW